MAFFFFSGTLCARAHTHTSHASISRLQLSPFLLLHYERFLQVIRISRGKHLIKVFVKTNYGSTFLFRINHDVLIISTANFALWNSLTSNVRNNGLLFQVDNLLLGVFIFFFFFFNLFICSERIYEAMAAGPGRMYTKSK